MAGDAILTGLAEAGKASLQASWQIAKFAAKVAAKATTGGKA